MENMQYAEELLREFLVFRGFTNTLHVFEKELTTDIAKNFQVDKIIDLIFKVYIPKYEVDKLVGLLHFFKQCFTSPSDAVLLNTLLKLELSVLRYYVVHALQSGRQDKVVEFFNINANHLLLKREDWVPWFALPYLKNPSLDPNFHVYFSKDWFDALLLSVRNFLSEIFNGSRIPALLKISTEKNTVKRLKNDIKQLNHKLSELQALLEVKDTEVTLLKSVQENRYNNSNSSHLVEDHTGTSACSSHSGENILRAKNGDSSEFAKEEFKSLMLGSISSSLSNFSLKNNETEEDIQVSEAGGKGEISVEEEFPEVNIEYQETFLGHTSPISRCRFSASGTNIASASVDGTVRIWTYDSSTPTSRNATIYCGAEIMSLDWECRSDRLLLIGTADGGIKAWNVDAKRVVCDLNTSQEFPSVLDLKCSPVDPIFVSAAASKRQDISYQTRRGYLGCTSEVLKYTSGLSRNSPRVQNLMQGSNKVDSLGLASLTVWNMKTWKAMSVLPLGKDPPAITSLSFNHNGKILAASSTDGMIHMFDMSAGLQITGWPAHDTSVSSVLFGPDETSIFSLGSDGKIFEWSLHNQGQVLWSRDCSRFCYPESEKQCRHEMALDSTGKRLLVTSGSVRSPIYQVQGNMSGQKTLPHTAAITSVDWHPTLPIFITGSADHSVRVTSIL